MSTNIVLVGAPGSGKGTQAKRLEDELGMIQVSTGDILRQAKRDGTELGLKAKAFMDEGNLVPDELIVAIIQERFQDPMFKQKGWILDGFPRTLAQAKALDAMLEKSTMAINSVPFLKVPDSALVGRITGRRSCQNCGSVFHVEHMPPKQEGVCDHCGDGKLYQREDDTEAKVRVRLDAFQSMVNEVIPYYENQGLVKEIDGDRDPKDVYQSLISVVNG